MYALFWLCVHCFINCIIIRTSGAKETKTFKGVQTQAVVIAFCSISSLFSSNSFHIIHFITAPSIDHLRKSFCACAVTAQLAPSMGALVLVGKHEPGRPSLVHLCAVTELSRLALAAYRNASALCGLRLHELFYSERKHAFLQVPVREATCRKERCLGSCCEETECRRFAVGAQQTFSDLQRAFHNRTAVKVQEPS